MELVENKRVTGCIIRVRHHNRMVLRQLLEVFHGEYDTEIVENTLVQNRMGNLDLEGWLSSFASDLEEIRSEGELPNFGQSINLSIELVYGKI